MLTGEACPPAPSTARRASARRLAVHRHLPALTSLYPGGAAPRPPQQPQRVGARDLLGHLGAVARHQRLLHVAHAAEVLETRERGLDPAVEVRADAGVVVGAGDLGDAIDVRVDERHAVLEGAHLALG